MKMKSCITIAFREFIHSIKTFALYFIILVCLESISITMLKAATDTPDKIADIADELGYNYLNIECNKISDIENIFEREDMVIDYVCSDMAPSFISDFFDDSDSYETDILNLKECVVSLSDKFENQSVDYLHENMISGNFIPDTDKNHVWISDELSQQLGISTGDILRYDDAKIFDMTFEVAGIYTADKNICDLFMSENTYKNARSTREYSDDEQFDICVKCSDFSKIKVFCDRLSEKGLEFDYYDEMQSAVNMMYASFYAAVVILSVALTGIVIYLSELYYNKRRSFFSVNYIIGMSQKDIIRIIFTLLSMLLVFSLLVAGCVCMLIMGYFDNYLFDLFKVDFELSGFPIKQFLIYFVVICICLLIVLVRIRKLIKKTFTSSSGRNL
ncbi:MAG: ABC transporter permease [Oscillospiraceae bacterium]|nr:ABC transporter permease [Oscillospiraceae bacterium]